MTLKELALENFAAVGERRQKLAFAPITLLFGPNGAGKSSILKALRYVHNILAHDTVDPARFPERDRDLFGPYQTLVHDHDLESTIRIRVAADVVFPSLPWLDEAEADADAPVTFKLNSEGDGGDVAIEFAVLWSRSEEAPYLAEIDIEIEGLRFASLSRSPDRGRMEISEFNPSHPRLAFLELDEDGDPDLLEARALWVTETERWIVAPDEDDPPLPLSLLIGRGQTLPPTDRPLRFFGSTLFLDPVDEEDRDDETENPMAALSLATRAARRVLSAGILLPLGGIKRELDRIVQLGPLRTLPARDFEPQPLAAGEKLHNGEAAWHILPNLAKDKLDTVNEWLGGRKGLDTRFRIEVERYREVPLAHPLMGALEGVDLLDEVPELFELVQELPVKSRVRIRDIDTELLHQPADVAVGISQLLPVVVYAVATEGQFCVIEQPELHVHPAIQVRLGDLFIERAIDPEIDEPRKTRNQFLIETHSEHLILRLLRRVRESAQGRLPPGCPKLTPDHISVAYVEPRETGAVIKRLRVNEEGDFIDRWPKGFFDERDQELFDLADDGV